MKIDGGLDPIDRIQWLDASVLTANHYNPNVVMSAEFDLLERSILITGWVQPVLATPKYTIIDGFHRWSLSSRSEKIRRVYGGKLPVAILDITEADAMLLTVRINRAKGTHLALRMSDIVRTLIDEHKCTKERVQAELGASAGEVDLLYKGGVFKAKDTGSHRYSQSWRPVESATRPPLPAAAVGLPEAEPPETGQALDPDSEPVL